MCFFESLFHSCLFGCCVNDSNGIEKSWIFHIIWLRRICAGNIKTADTHLITHDIPGRSVLLFWSRTWEQGTPGTSGKIYGLKLAKCCRARFICSNMLLLLRYFICSNCSPPRGKWYVSGNRIWLFRSTTITQTQNCRNLANWFGAMCNLVF